MIGDPGFVENADRNGQTLQPAIIADVMFLHDRGKHNTLYFVMHFGDVMVRYSISGCRAQNLTGSQLGPVVSGLMGQYAGWRNFWWLYAAMNGFIFLACLFGFPETKWHRKHPDEL